MRTATRMAKSQQTAPPDRNPKEIRRREFAPNATTAGFLSYRHDWRECLRDITSGFSELLLVQWILAETVGSKKNRKGQPPIEWTDPVTNRQLSREIRSDTTEGVEWIVAAALSRGIIAREEAPAAKPQKGKSYRYKALVENWEYIQSYKDWKKENLPQEPEDEPEETESRPSALRATVTITTEPLVMLPGAKSRPAPLSVAMADSEKPVRLNLEYENLTSGQIAVQAVHIDAKRIRFAISNGSKPGASPPPEGPLHPSVLGRNSANRPSINTGNPQIAELQAALDPIAGQFFGKSVDGELAARTLGELAECPIDYLTAFWLQRLKRGGVKSLGLLTSISREALAAWRKQHAAAEAENAAARRAGEAREKLQQQEEAESERLRPALAAIFERHKTRHGYDLNAIEADPEMAGAGPAGFEMMRRSPNCKARRYWPTNPYDFR